MCARENISIGAPESQTKQSLQIQCQGALLTP